MGFSQSLVDNNYIEQKYLQFQEHPIVTAFEILVPYIVTYASNTIYRKIN
jgi:hypothetical protein